MEAVRGIVRNIAIVILLAAFLEMLLPNNSMQRFVRLVMGLFVLMAVLSPVANLLHMPLTFEIPAWSTASDSGNDQELAQVFKQGELLKQQNEQSALDQYKQAIEREVKALALTVQGVNNAVVGVDIKNNGEISQLTVDAGQLDSTIPAVQPIDIQGQAPAENRTLTTDEQRIGRELKSRLSALLGIKEEKILVRFGPG